MPRGIVARHQQEKSSRFSFFIDEYPDRTNTVCMSPFTVAKVGIYFQPCKYFFIKMYNKPATILRKDKLHAKGRKTPSQRPSFTT